MNMEFTDEHHEFMAEFLLETCLQRIRESGIEHVPGRQKVVACCFSDWIKGGFKDAMKKLAREFKLPLIKWIQFCPSFYRYCKIGPWKNRIISREDYKEGVQKFISLYNGVFRADDIEEEHVELWAVVRSEFPIIATLDTIEFVRSVRETQMIERIEEGPEPVPETKDSFMVNLHNELSGLWMAYLQIRVTDKEGKSLAAQQLLKTLCEKLCLN